MIRNCLGMVFLVLLTSLAIGSSARGQEPVTHRVDGVFPNMQMELQATPGCLGVDQAKTESGKDVTFAWFKDKESLLNWYYSELHQTIMRKTYPGRVFRAPLENVPDNSGPIMVIASVTFDDQAKLGGRFPISELSIELYTPLNGGLFVGGRFAPAVLSVPNMLEYTPDGTLKEAK